MELQIQDLISSIRKEGIDAANAEIARRAAVILRQRADADHHVLDLCGQNRQDNQQCSSDLFPDDCNYCDKLCL